jgi:hypothetical protein
MQIVLSSCHYSDTFSETTGGTPAHLGNSVFSVCSVGDIPDALLVKS